MIDSVHRSAWYAASMRKVTQVVACGCNVRQTRAGLEDVVTLSLMVAVDAPLAGSAGGGSLMICDSKTK